MIRAAQIYFAAIPAVFIDGLIYVGIAVFAFLQTVMGSDEAARFISPLWLFVTKTFVGAMAAGLLAIKLFRSTAFADHQQKKAADKAGEFDTREFRQVTKTELTSQSSGTTVAKNDPPPTL